MRTALVLIMLGWLAGCRAEPPPPSDGISLERHGQALAADGFPPDGVWRQADSLALADLRGGTALQAPTRIALTYAEGRLCLRARCDDPDAEHLVYASRLRDAAELWRDDSLELWLAIGDEAARFVVNPGGALLDERFRDGTADRDWDAAAGVRCSIDAGGWTAELAIPIHGLLPATPAAGPLALRANVLRVRQGREGAYAEESSWRPAASGGSWHDAAALATIRLPVDAPTLARETRLLPPRLPPGLRAGAPPAEGEAILRALYRTTVALRPLPGPGTEADPAADPSPLRLQPQNPAMPVAPEPASVRLVAGAEALLVRIDCADRDPAAIATGAGVPAGELWRQDCVEILLSPERKASGHWQFIVTPSGRWTLLRDRRTLPAEGVQVQAAVGAGGWQATLRIPYAVFGLARGGLPALWGLNITRNRPMRADAPQQSTCWSPLDQDHLGLLWLAGADRHPDIVSPPTAAGPSPDPGLAPADPAFTVLAPDACRDLRPGTSPLRRYEALRDELFARRDARLAAIASWTEVEALQEELRDGFRRSLGGLPAERTPLAPRVALACERDGLRIERVVYDSRPGFPVTANLFLPTARSGRLPAVFRLQGHSTPGRLATRDLAIDAELASLGYAVFAIDLPGQGERILVRNGNGLRSPTDNHYAEGTACQLTGGNLAAHMIWDVMRGIDYLATRAEVDPARIVLTGVSGGGGMAGYVAALEPRIAAVAPVSALNSARGHRGSYDAEQVLFAGVQRWLDVQGFAIMTAPRPFLVITEASEDGEAQTRADLAAVRRLYDLRQAGDLLGYHPTRAPHGIGDEHYRPFKAWLLRTMPPDPRPAATGGRAPTRAELRCSSTGSVYHAPEFAGAVSVLGLNQGRIRSDGALPGRLAELLGLEAADAAASAAEPHGVASWQGLAVERLLLTGEPGIPLPAVLVSAAQAPARGPALVVVGDRGKTATAAARQREIAELCQAGIRVLLPDLRGTGETAASSDYGYRDSGESELAGFGLRLGRPLIGRRVRDLQACVDHLRRRPDVDAERIALWGDSLARPNDPAVRQWRVLPEERGVEAQAQAESVAPLAALYATVLDPRLVGCASVGMLKSFAPLCATPYAQHPYALCTPGILQHGDIPDLLRACAPRPLLLVAPVDALNRASARGASPRFPDSDSAAYATALAATHCRVVEQDRGDIVPFLCAALGR